MAIKGPKKKKKLKAKDARLGIHRKGKLIDAHLGNGVGRSEPDSHNEMGQDRLVKDGRKRPPARKR
jgi:hypothetical protein